VLLVLQALLGEAGLRADHVIDRQRAAATFVRVARALRRELLPHAAALLDACVEPMTISVDGERRLAFVDQLSLFEALGVVLSQTSEHVAPVAAVVAALSDGMRRVNIHSLRDYHTHTRSPSNIRYWQAIN
jgi:hypothetical protein